MFPPQQYPFSPGTPGSHITASGFPSSFSQPHVSNTISPYMNSKDRSLIPDSAMNVGQMYSTGNESHSPYQLGRLTLSPIELPCYQYLWHMADSQNLGYLSGQLAAEFLSLSGLPRPILHEIWRLADYANEGILRFEEFCVACRLISHAQNGLPVLSENISQEPLSVPQFDISQHHSSVSDTSSILGTPMVPIEPLLDPAAAAVSLGYPPGMFNSTQFASSGSGMSNLNNSRLDTSNNLYLLNETDQQKYINIFQRSNIDKEGYLPGEEAKIVLSKSGLPDSQLSQIWMVADQDSDGRLSLQEFIVAMHLISLCRKGAPIPTTLPPELEFLFTGDFLSANRPLFEFPGSETKKDSPLMNITPDTSPGNMIPQKGSLMHSEKNSFWGSLDSPPTTSDTIVTPHETITTEDAFPNFTFEKPIKTKRRLKDDIKKQMTDTTADLSFGDLIDNEQLTLSSRDDEKEFRKTSSRRHRQSIPKIEIEQDLSQHIEEKTDEISKSKYPKQIIKDAIEVDRDFTKHVMRSVDKYSEELNELTGVSEALKAELIREKKNLKRQLDRRVDFENQLRELKIELGQIQEERRKIDHKKISVSRDLNHYQDEMLFLKQQIDDVRKDIEQLGHSNLAFEKNIKGTETQIHQLDGARKTTLHILGNEKEELKKQEELIIEMRQTLEKMRREKEDTQAKYAILQEKLRQADQDRGLLLHSVETERGKLAGIQTMRLEAADERVHLAQRMAELEQDWSSNRRVPGFRTFNETQHPSSSIHFCLPSSTDTSTTRLPRDSKGVPSGATSTALTPVYPLGRSSDLIHTSTGSDIRNQFFSTGCTSNGWTSFGTSGRSGVTDPLDINRFYSVGLEKESRGIDRLSREVTKGSTGTSSSFNRFKEPTHLGTRRSERLQFTQTNQDDQRSTDTENDTEDIPSLTQRHLSNITKKKQRAKTHTKLNDKTEQSVETSGNESLDFIKGKKPKNNFPGIETPSFGSRSLQRCNSFSSQ